MQPARHKCWAWRILSTHIPIPRQPALSKRKITLSLSSLSNWKTILEAPVEEPAKEEIVVEQKEKEIESESNYTFGKFTQDSSSIENIIDLSLDWPEVQTWPLSFLQRIEKLPNSTIT